MRKAFTGREFTAATLRPSVNGAGAAHDVRTCEVSGVSSISKPSAGWVASVAQQTLCEPRRSWGTLHSVDLDCGDYLAC